MYNIITFIPGGKQGIIDISFLRLELFSNLSPNPLPLAREGGGLPRVSKRGVKPLSINLFPLSFEGEGDKGGEVNKHSQVGYLLLWWVFIIIYGMSQKWGILSWGGVGIATPSARNDRERSSQ